MGEQQGDLVLELGFTLAAPQEQVFRLLTDPDELVKWWGPEGFTTPEAELDPRPGGSYRLTMQPPDGDAFHVTGTFLEVDRPRRLAFTFRYEEPAPDDRETVVVLSLVARADGTQITVSQGPFATDERRDLHLTGWTESLERLRDGG
jgi:uncharacterized protein YndB with AHSA1/START domain